jgi:hypothetical protein
LHLLLVVAVPLQAVFSLVSRNRTVLAPRREWQVAQNAVSFLLGSNLPDRNPIRRGIVGYLNVAGIETSYGYFAPNVPYNYKLVFELHYPDGHVEYTLPEVGAVSVGKRLSNLFDYIGHVRRDELRQTLIKMLAYSVLQNHPEVDRMRAVFGYVRLPTVEEFREGGKESYQTLYVYDLQPPVPPGSSP